MSYRQHRPSGTVNDRPNPPRFTLKDLAKQFKADVWGKEVQDPSSYSYTWMADQVGHVCLGILLYFLFTLIVRGLGSDWVSDKLPKFGAWIHDWATSQFLTTLIPDWQAHWTEWTGGVIAAVVVSLYELATYLYSVKKANGLFTLDKKLLGENALIATVYLVIGVVVGRTMQFALQQNHPWAGLVVFVALFVLAIVCAPGWLCQKMAWQKAALPFVFRLANVPLNIAKQDADRLQCLIDEAAPPGQAARQVVICGPIGSGRTELAAGIGTEFAFKNRKVRYVSFTALLEFAGGPLTTPHHRNDSGPDNIEYWPWIDAQVLIIDDVGPLISAQPQGVDKLLQFKTLLANELQPVGHILAKCHTVWVIGDLRTAAATVCAGLDRFASAIVDYCGGKPGDQLAIELADRSEQPAGRKGPTPATVKAVRAV